MILNRTAGSSNRVHETRADNVFNIFNYLFLGIILFLVLYPLVYVVSASLSEPSAVLAGRVKLLPVDFTLRGYEKIFEHRGLMTGFANSMIYAFLGAIIGVIVTLMAAYPLSRDDMPGRRFLTFFFVFTMLFSGGLIPFYLTVNKLGMIDTRWALLLPTAMSPWNILIAIAFFRSSIPSELHDAAQIDGCDDFKYIFRVVLPLSKPLIAILFLFVAVWQWNQYFQAMIFLNDPGLYPVQLYLRQILVLNEIDLSMISDLETLAMQQGMKEQLKFSVIVVASLPLLLLYPFVQRYFVTGMTLGAVKG